MWCFLVVSGHKAKEFKKLVEADHPHNANFKASAGWLSKVLKRHSKIGVKLHGEASDIPPEMIRKIKTEWLIRFHATVVVLVIIQYCRCSASSRRLQGWDGTCLVSLWRCNYGSPRDQEDYRGFFATADSVYIALQPCWQRQQQERGIALHAVAFLTVK